MPFFSHIDREVSHETTQAILLIADNWEKRHEAKDPNLSEEELSTMRWHANQLRIVSRWEELYQWVYNESDSGHIVHNNGYISGVISQIWGLHLHLHELAECDFLKGMEFISSMNSDNKKLLLRGGLINVNYGHSITTEIEREYVNVMGQGHIVITGHDDIIVRQVIDKDYAINIPLKKLKSQNTLIVRKCAIGSGISIKSVNADRFPNNQRVVSISGGISGYRLLLNGVVPVNNPPWIDSDDLKESNIDITLQEIPSEDE